MSSAVSSKMASKSMKPESTAGGKSGGKPNAWSKPLQSAAKPGSNPSDSNKKGPSSSSSSSSNGTSSNKTPSAPPGLAAPAASTTTSNGRNNNGTSNNSTTRNDNGTSNSSSSNDDNVMALRERFLHLLLTVTGQSVSVTMKTGKTYTGVLHTATPFSHLPESHRFKYVLKAVTSKEDPSVDGSTLILEMKDVTQLQVKSCRLDSLVQHSKGGAASGETGDAFTDTEISAAAAATAINSRSGKDLVSAGSHWTSEPSTKTNSRAGALEGGIAGWDQFKANEKLFGVEAKFDETVYTTVLDPTNISRHDQQRAAALAKEIESSATTNMHVAEERGHVPNQDFDEEDRYSGVLKSTAVSPSRPINSMAAKLNYAAAAKTRPPGFGDKATPPAQAKAEAFPNEGKPAAKEKNEKAAAPAPAVATPDVSAAAAAAPKEPEKKEEKPAPASEPAAKEPTKAEGEKEAPATEKKEEEKPASEAPKSKLNVNAKEFSFNINAKSFTPGAPSAMPSPPPPPQQAQFIDPNTGYPVMPMQIGMPQGMMPQMMGHFPGVRGYPQYPGMEQGHHIPQHHMPGPGQPLPPPPPVTSSTPSVTSGATSPAPVSDEGSSTQPPSLPQPQEGDAASETSSQAAPSQQQPQPPPPPPPPPQQSQPMPMYVQQGFYPGGQVMHPGHPPQQFMHPAQLAAMQQHQRQMGYPVQPGHMPPNMMRAPNGMPYYAGPNGPIPYQMYAGGGPYGDDLQYDGGMTMYGGRASRPARSGGRPGRQGRGSRGGGRTSRGGGRSYQQQHSGGYHSNSSSQPGSGRQTPQQQQQQHPHQHPRPHGYEQQQQQQQPQQQQHGGEPPKQHEGPPPTEAPVVPPATAEE